MSNVRLGEIIRVFSKKDAHNVTQELKYSIGHDSIHSNHLNFALLFLKILLLPFFQALLIMALDILKGIFNPTIKDRYGNLRCSDNYRPFMSSSVILK